MFNFIRYLSYFYTNYITNENSWLAKTLYIQVVLSSFSLPLLLTSGISISTLTFIGNIVFAPLFAAFLFCSLILFACELLGIPSGIWVSILNTLGALWEYISQNMSLYATFLELPAPPLFISILFLITVTLCILHKNFNTRLKRSCALSAVTSIFIGGIALWAHTRDAHALYNHKNIVLRCFKTNNSLLIIDPGSFTTRKQVLKHINEHFFRFLRKELGSTALTHILILKTTAASAALVEALGQHTNTGLALFVPEPLGIPPVKTREAYRELSKWAEQEKHTLIFYTTQGEHQLTEHLTLIPSGLLQRSKSWKHPLCALKVSTSSNSSSNPDSSICKLTTALDPLVTQREQVQPLYPSMPGANIPTYTALQARTLDATLQ